MQILRTTPNPRSRLTVVFAAALLAAGPSWAQVATTATDEKKPKETDDVVVLSPFEVSSAETNGYAADSTLAGNRLKTELRDIGNAVSVITTKFMKDIGATDNLTLLQYTTNTEVGSVYGNFAGFGDGPNLDETPRFANPNQNTRVRGLTSADNTRDFFLTDIPWEGYNIDGVDLQRGPNSILFGQGSPAGIINTRTKSASFKDSNEVSFRIGSFGSNRVTLDVNKVLIKNELAVRLAAVRADEQYKQDPAFSKNERVYGAIRWEPGFLKKGSARTIIKANIEFGRVKSNNPRSIPPIDKITPWFMTGTTEGVPNLNKLTVNPQQNVDGNTGLPNHGQTIPTVLSAANPWYQPWVGNLGNQFGNPTAIFNYDSPTALGNYIAWEPPSNHGIGPNGLPDVGGVGGIPFQRPAGVNGYAQFAKNAKLPYSNFGLYKDKSLTDASVFDFYNQLLDGPNKSEWQNFRTYNLSIAQTFFHDHVGFDASYNNEWFKSGSLSLLDGNGAQAIGIDMNSNYSDGLANGTAAPSANGTPNPNVGRAYLTSASQWGNQSYLSNKSTKRLTLFGRHNFDQGSNRTWLTKLLGDHTLTALANKDIQKTDKRNWNRYGTDAAYEAFVNVLTPGARKIRFSDNVLTPNTVIYLGPSRASATTASGLNLPSPTAVITPTSGSVWTFDSTWNRSTVVGNPNYVDPAAFWSNGYYPPTNTASNSTQSENPANYVGFRAVPLTVIDSETSAANRNLLTHGASLSKSQISSTAATWQGKFWQNAVVATYGIRRDISKAWNYTLNTNSALRPETGTAAQIAEAKAFNALHPAPTDAYGHLNLLNNSYQLPSGPTSPVLDIKSRAWTVMTHLNQLPGLSKLPIQVSLFYNHSTNFQPASSRIDLYGTPLAPPEGKTKDMGILLETKDGKYSLKINKYENSAVNATSGSLDGSWFIGSSQAWSANWVNRFEFNWTGDTNANAVPVPDPTNSQYNYGTAPGENLAQAQAREAGVIAAYRTWQASVDPRFYAAWGINLNDKTKSVSASTPNGFTVTEDSVSKGYEIELNAVPTKNWRLTVNASKTTAIRNNIGGSALAGFIAGYEKALNTTAAGDLRIWWGGYGGETSLSQWNGNIGSNYALRKLQEGTKVPEMREWRFNAINNYSFDHGFLKGVNVGSGIRYESDIVIGYKPIPGTGGRINFDLVNPYMGPAETNFDFWVGYSRRIWRNIDWNIQLNVRNAFVGNELIPLTVQPDGSPAAYRIQPPQTWQITNTFKF